MSFEWARAREIQNRGRERQRAQAIQGPDGPEVEMVYPIGVTFWGQSAPVELRPVSPDEAPHIERTPRENAADPNHVRTEGSEST